MTEKRVTATNQFSTVIDALQLGQKTGILSVERGDGKTFEVGTITFANGQVVDATLGAYHGREAATKLFSWQACRFSFVPMLLEQIASIPIEPAEAGIAGKRFPPEMRVAHPGMQADGGRRPFLTTDVLESLDAILSSLDKQGLTRTHRRLFLLIDGKRTVEELAALIRRTPDEVIALLADLEQAGFIQLEDAH